MFCHKCGHKTIDNAVFCEKCGAKLINDVDSATNKEEITNEKSDITPQIEISNIHNDNGISEETLNIYNRLKSNSENCSKIKDIITKDCLETGQTTVIKGRFFNYHCIYSPINQTPFVTTHHTWLNYIISFICMCLDGIFLALFFNDEYYLPLSIFLIIECMLWISFLICSYKEQKEIVSHINKSLNLNLSISKIPAIISGVLNGILMILGCIAIILSLGNMIEDVSSNKELSNDVEDYDSDLVGLSYENSKEGISFMYPNDWIVTDNPEDVAYLYHSSSDSSLYAEMSIYNYNLGDSRYIDIFSAKEKDIEAEYLSDENIENVNIHTFKNTKINGCKAKELKISYNILGNQLTTISYFYTNNNKVYTVSFVTYSAIFDEYESIFDAIIYSYTIFEGTDEESYDSIEDNYYQNYDYDSELVGRWRSYDGGALEFDENGVLLSCDFIHCNLPSSYDDRNCFEWCSNNGTIAITSYRYYEYTYYTFPPSVDNEYEILRLFDDWGWENYERVDGTVGGGLVGKWDRGNYSSTIYQLNEDGTGIFAKKQEYPLTWYSYNNGVDDVLSMTIAETAYFDYKISGDILTVFLDDESRVYTKIGN